MADEPRSVVVPPAAPGAAQNVAVATPAIPGRLVGGTAIKVVSSGLSWSISLDIGELSEVPSGTVEDNAWLPVLFGSSGATYRLTLGDLAAELPVAWVNIVGKPATYPPSLPIAQSGVAGLVTRLGGVDATLSSYGTRITNVETSVATKIGDAPSNGVTYGRNNGAWVSVSALTDGNKGDVIVSGGGAAWTIGPNAVDAGKIGDPELKAIGNLTSTADKLPYFTGPGAADLTDFPVQARSLLAATTAAAQRSVLIANPNLNRVQVSGGFTVDLGTTSAERSSVTFVKGPGSFGCFHCDVEVSRLTSGTHYGFIKLRVTNITDSVVVAETEESTLEITNAISMGCSKTIVRNDLVEGKTYKVSILGRADAPSAVSSPNLRIEGFHG